MLLKLYGEVMFSKLRIGAEEAKAPMTMCGYFNLNQVASTANQEEKKKIKYIGRQLLYMMLRDNEKSK